MRLNVLLTLASLSIGMYSGQSVWASDDSTNGSVSSSAKTDDKRHTGSPLCAISTLKESDFVRSGGWPGVGPFKDNGTTSGSEGELEDPNRNRIHMSLSDDKITSLDLYLNNQGKGSLGFLNLQMSIDFLLEAIGAKSKRITALNAVLDKNRLLLFSQNSKGLLEFQSGSYLLNIKRYGQTGAEEFSVKIDATAPIPIAAASVPSSTDLTSSPPAKPKEQVPKTPKLGDSKSSDDSNDGIFVIDTNAPKPSTTDNTVKTAIATPKFTPKTDSKSDAKTDAKSDSTSTASTDDLKSQFQDVISNWQKIKQTAIKTKQVDELEQALSGKALARQKVAIKWLQDNHKYYDMTPEGVNVDRYAKLKGTTGQKYAVYAQVRELSKLIDDASGQTIKELKDSYLVNYTIEKNGDHWIITDSALVKPPQKDGSAAKTKP